jgi:hypothetical protein
LARSAASWISQRFGNSGAGFGPAQIPRKTMLTTRTAIQHVCLWPPIADVLAVGLGCPLSEVKRTCRLELGMSANDPKRTRMTLGLLTRICAMLKLES